MEMTRNNVFSCWWRGYEKSRLSSVLCLKRAGFSLADVQSDVLLSSSRMHITAFSNEQLLVDDVL